MYAVIKVGGKQQRVKPGDVIEAEYQKGEEAGGSMTFRPILVVDDDGKAHHGKDLQGATVTAKVLGEQKGEKVKVVKYRPKTRYARHQGHRQLQTLLEISEIGLADGRTARGETPAEAPAEAAPAKPAAKKRAAKPAAKAPAKAEPESAPAEEPEAAPDQPEGEGG